MPEPISAATMLGIAALTSGASFGASMLMDKPGEQGNLDPIIVDDPARQYATPTFQAANQLGTQTLQGIQETGQVPWYEQAKPVMREDMMSQLKNTFYGTPMGGPGVFDAVRNAGAAAGIGPSPMLQQTLKVGQEYGAKASEIDRYLTKLGVDVTQGQTQVWSQFANQAIAGTRPAVIPGGQYNVPPDTSASDAVASFGQTLPWLAGGAPGTQQPNLGGDFTGVNNTGGYPTSSLSGQYGPNAGQPANYYYDNIDQTQVQNPTSSGVNYFDPRNIGKAYEATKNRITSLFQ